MDEEVPVEAGDLQRPPGLEPGRGEAEAAAVGHPRARLDQHAERRRVDEPDCFEVDDERLGLSGAGVEQGGSHLLGVVEVELADERDDDRAVPAVDSAHGRFAPSGNSGFR